MKIFAKKERPSWWVILIPLFALVVNLFLVIKVFGADALEGGSQIALFIATALVVLISVVFYKITWDQIESSIVDNIKTISSAILILFMIGAVSGSWMVSGVVPTLIYYGISVIKPEIFLFASCLISALISLMTGSSWTTIATIGVALIGIGTAQGYDAGWTAGAIISGAYFGDKISPLSDTTTLASSSTNTPLFTHIRYMLKTTIPSFAITLIIFLVASLSHNDSNTYQMIAFAEDLSDSFNITPWLFLIPIITAVLIALKVPALITLFLSAVLAAIVSLFSQPHIIWQIANNSSTAAGFLGLDFISGFKGMMISLYGETSIDVGNEILNELVQTNGMTGMLPTIFLIISAAAFGGSLVGSGMIQSLTEVLLNKIKRTTSIVTSTVGTGIFCDMVTGDQYLSIILTGNLYRQMYKKTGLESRLLSRSIEDSATVCSVLIPWNSCGMTQATVLKVATLDYLPYCFFNLISPLMSIFIAAIGYKIKKH